MMPFRCLPSLLSVGQHRQEFQRLFGLYVCQIAESNLRETHRSLATDERD